MAADKKLLEYIKRKVVEDTSALSALSIQNTLSRNPIRIKSPNNSDISHNRSNKSMERPH